MQRMCSYVRIRVGVYCEGKHCMSPLSSGARLRGGHLRSASSSHVSVEVDEFGPVARGLGGLGLGELLERADLAARRAVCGLYRPGCGVRLIAAQRR
jgi:hypothetical protein